MAIYHNEVKMITRGEGRSACAASAYISCSAIYNDYDGIQHDYIALHEAIKTHKTDLRRLQKEKDALPMVSIRKRRDLTSQIEEKEAEIAKLQKRKKAVMQKCGKTDHTGMQEIPKQIAMAKAAIRHVDDRWAAIQEAIAKSKRSFLELLKSSPEYDRVGLEQERMAFRNEAEAATRNEIKEKTGVQIQEAIYGESQKMTEKTLENQQEKGMNVKHISEEIKTKAKEKGLLIR